MINTTTTSGTSGGVINGNFYGGSFPVAIGGNTSAFPYTYTTTTIPNNDVVTSSKRCRDCNHAHLNNECIEFTDWGQVTFAKCNCKEYAPKDNLEYLEYLYDKKQRKEKTSSL